MAVELEIPKRPTRHLLPEDFKVTSWEGLKVYYDELLNRPLLTKEDLEKWLKHRSELESVISEDLGWRYIRMTCFTDNEEHGNAYKDFIQNIQPQIAPLSDLLNKKVASRFVTIS
jgi:oligoendopeptidase F